MRRFCSVLQDPSSFRLPGNPPFSPAAGGQGLSAGEAFLGFSRQLQFSPQHAWRLPCVRTNSNLRHHAEMQPTSPPRGCDSFLRGRKFLLTLIPPSTFSAGIEEGGGAAGERGHLH